MTDCKDDASMGWMQQAWARFHRRPHFTVCALIFVIAAILLSFCGLRIDLSVLFAFDIAAVIYLVTTAVMFSRSDEQSIRRRAHQEDEGYWGFLLSSAAIATVMLVALAAELQTNKSSEGLSMALAAFSLVVTWLFMNTIFALHYAHEFYGDSGSQNAGLIFPGNIDPDYWDFVYFAFVIGMTFQVSDVQIDSRAIRRVVLIQAVIAFFFNVTVVALSVNIISSNT